MKRYPSTWPVPDLQVGFDVTDPFTGQHCRCHLNMMTPAADSRGYADLFQCAQAPARQNACPCCKDEGVYAWHKGLYLGVWKFLPLSDVDLRQRCDLHQARRAGQAVVLRCNMQLYSLPPGACCGIVTYPRCSLYEVQLCPYTTCRCAAINKPQSIDCKATQTWQWNDPAPRQRDDAALKAAAVGAQAHVDRAVAAAGPSMTEAQLDAVLKAAREQFEGLKVHATGSVCCLRAVRGSSHAWQRVQCQAFCTLNTAGPA